MESVTEAPLGSWRAVWQAWMFQLFPLLGPALWASHLSGPHFSGCFYPGCKGHCAAEWVLLWLCVPQICLICVLKGKSVFYGTPHCFLWSARTKASCPVSPAVPGWAEPSQNHWAAGSRTPTQRAWVFLWCFWSQCLWTSGAHFPAHWNHLESFTRSWDSSPIWEVVLYLACVVTSLYRFFKASRWS